MKLIFEKSSIGQQLSLLPPCDVPVYELQEKRESELKLPSVSENELSRHYSLLAEQTFGINNGFYPLGSCTMKYNPKINEEMANLPNFTQIHPLQSEASIQGCLEVLSLCEASLCEITGMDNMTFQPAAGSHGEFVGLLLIKKYHQSRNDFKRDKIIVPDSAHGTNPASVAMAGFSIINIPSTADGYIDLEILRSVVGDDTAGFMLTNPNTLGLFETNIVEITSIIHDAGGLCYYDGANLNAIMGIARPGDMGFDCVHLNLHKTFSTPHGGGGPGSGPVGCKKELSPFLPGNTVIKEDEYSFEKPKQSMGMVKSFNGNFLVVVRALTYILQLGSDGIALSAANATLNANYMKHLLKDSFEMSNEGLCMHEFVMTLSNLKKETGVTALDIAKGLLDYKIHPPTMYFPLIVEEALMVEVPETESKTDIEQAVEVFKKLKEIALTEPQLLKTAPHKTPVRRLDEVAAARKPILRWMEE
jgi:glycine dehydrogenase subunit 2